MSAIAAGGFDWSSALIAAAALVGLLVASIALIGAVREGKDRRLRRRKS